MLVDAPATPHHLPVTLLRFGTRFALVGVWLLFVVVYALLLPDTFLTSGAFRTIFGSQQPLVFLTAALLCTILVGEFVDMSVASNFGLAAISVTVLNVNHDWNVWAASLLAVAVSAAVGALNGWLVVKLGVNTIVVTLGMGTFLLGIALWISDLTPVSGLPASFKQIALLDVGGLPISFFLGLVLMVAFFYLLRFTPLGRNMRFVGESREVSRLAGVRVTRVRIGAFTAAGLIAGVGGVLAAAATGGFDPNVSNAYLLPMFAATFLGTAIIEPGRFNPLGTLIAVYFLATGVLGLQLLGATSWVSNVFYGGVLVVAVTITTLLHARSRSH
ncbi:ABC transporter permease [Virgisporangium aurantiacum]|uniref:Dolichyl-phosphate beta-glucosyltransferase n=1 Tax=Virgisporangium aurantiacum TaxID=175570 RepID=A0A8J3ZH66_9ACTN|nr:ABC transporter permease [Virgisporangium aurantiacum]GIJ62842.1 dolichyl-phosphate beta-glucosyltransferase [Virgisporangium aurantiacum]